MQSESKFAKAYNEGVAKTKYWEVREREREATMIASNLFRGGMEISHLPPPRLILLLRIISIHTEWSFPCEKKLLFRVASDVRIRSPN